MKTRHLFGLVMSVGFLASTSFAQQLGNPIRSDLGVGARAIALAGSYTALSEDVSGMFWNPAGLSFVDKPLASLSLGGLQPAVETVYQPGNKPFESDDRNQRFHIGNVGIVLPLSHCSHRPGPAIGFSYQNPYVTDFVLDYKGRLSGDGETDYFTNNYLTLGRLSFWTISGSLPLTEQFSLGASASLITGHEISELQYFQQTRTDSGENEVLNHTSYTRDYTGYDIRFGLMIRPNDYLSVGARLEIPGTIAFEEYGEQTLTGEDQYFYDYTLSGTLQSYYSASCGAAFALENLIFSTDVHTRAPRPKKSLSDHSGRFHSGGSMGLEWTPAHSCVSLRGGYGWDQFDPTPYVVSYEQETTEDKLPESESSTGIHNLSLGARWKIGDRGIVAVAYGRRFYKLQTEDVLEESHRLQHGTVEFSVRF